MVPEIEAVEHAHAEGGRGDDARVRVDQAHDDVEDVVRPAPAADLRTQRGGRLVY